MVHEFKHCAVVLVGKSVNAGRSFSLNPFPPKAGYSKYPSHLKYTCVLKPLILSMVNLFVRNCLELKIICSNNC